jgi:hypothetical protein
VSGFVLDASFALAYLAPDEEAGFAVRAAMVEHALRRAAQIEGVSAIPS